MDLNDNIVVIDYRMGNIRSILKTINKFGYNVLVTDDFDTIKMAGKLILPGVGHFQKGMERLKERNLIELLNQRVLKEKTPILGICLGMQLFSKFSEEGYTEGLGWINANTVRFNVDNAKYKIPHIGWNTLTNKKESKLFKDISPDNEYYFVHSYHVQCEDSKDILALTNYGCDFVSAIEKDNIFGTQFHPEKSHDWGARILFNFLKI